MLIQYPSATLAPIILLIKRLFDLICVIPSLLLLSPLFLLLWIWIRYDSEGSAFYRQTRVGENGCYFQLIKFRTMMDDAVKKGLSITVGHDHRITQVGAFLRKYKLDELPQLLNVLKGEMSLVGPRPEVPEYVDYYPYDVKEKILSVPPGITDNASIEFIDESALLEGKLNPERVYVEEILPIKLKYYLLYVEKRSLWVDIHLILRTLWKIVTQRLN